MSIKDIMDRWVVQTGRMSNPKVAAFCGMPDPVVLKQALATHDMVVMLVYRPFGVSVRKAKWRKARTCYMDQYWRRVWVKVGEVDKNRIQVFCLPITNVLDAPVVLEGLVNGRFKNYSIGLTSDQAADQLVDYQVEFYPVSDINTEAWNPPAGFNRGFTQCNNEYTALMQAEDLDQAALYELRRTDDETQLYTLGAMTDNYVNKSATDRLED